MNSPKRVVLVTGSARSGTTVVGKTLGFAKESRYLYEPMHAERGMISVENWCEIPGTKEFPVALADKCIRDIENLSFRLKPVQNVHGNLISQLTKKYLTGTRTNVSYRLCQLDFRLTTVIWKDPLACFMAKHVAAGYDIPVIVTVRNPFATAASFKRLNWGTNYDDIEDVGLRLSEIGFNFVPVISRLRRHEISAARGAATFWFMVYSVLLEWQRENPKFLFVIMEELIRNPITYYRLLYRFAKLNWNNDVENKIRNMYNNSSINVLEPKSGKVHDLRRSEASVSEYWRRALDENEKNYCWNLNGELWETITEVGKKVFWSVGEIS